MNKMLKHKVDSLSTGPGVYMFLDSSEKIIYIGKALNLKKRVKSYFQKDHKDYKTPLLVQNIFDIEFIETESEIEALFLEAELIKRHKPLYNVRERDDKNFIYIRITVKDEFPIVSLVRRPADDKARYFGPFVQSYGVRQALKYLRRAFPYFSKERQKYSSKLEYQIGVLPSPDIDKADYRKIINKLIMVLEGKSTRLIKDLEKNIAKLSKQHKYEEAIELRNQYLALKSLNSRIVFSDQQDAQRGVDLAMSGITALLALKKVPKRIECYDISNFAGGDSVSSMVVFTNGIPDNKQYRHFKMYTKGPNDFAMMRETLMRRFSIKNNNWPKPDLIIVDGGKGQLSSARKVLSEIAPGILAVGLAKRYETVFIHNDDINNPSNEFVSDGEYYSLNFENNSPILHLFQRIRDEAHRFAVSYHTKLRNKRVAKSELDSIEGVGPARKKMLIRHFGSVKGVKAAKKVELVPIVGEKIAERITLHLSGN